MHLLDSRVAPVVAVVVTGVGQVVRNAGALECLFLIEHGKDTEDHRLLGVERNALQAMKARLADVLKVHRRAFDERADCDDRVEVVLLEHPVSVQTCAHVHTKRQLPATRHRVNDDVLRLDSRLADCLESAKHKCVNHLLVPASMDNADAEALGALE